MNFIIGFILGFISCGVAVSVLCCIEEFKKDE